MQIPYKIWFVNDIPKTSKVQHILKKGQGKFIDIEIRENLNCCQSRQTIKVFETPNAKRTMFAVQKKSYSDFFNCFDINNEIIKNIFICKICHNIFSSAGGNLARHAAQHFHQMQNDRALFLKK